MSNVSPAITPSPLLMRLSATARRMFAPDTTSHRSTASSHRSPLSAATLSARPLVPQASTTVRSDDPLWNQEEGVDGDAEVQENQENQDETEETNGVAVAAATAVRQSPSARLSHGRFPVPATRDATAKMQALKEVQASTAANRPVNKEKHAAERQVADRLIEQLLADTECFVMFTDGSCKPNPGYGGAACCLVRPGCFTTVEDTSSTSATSESDTTQLETKEQAIRFTGKTTNNITELTAMQMGLKLLAEEQDP